MNQANVFSSIRKVWNDPVWSKVIAAAIIFISAAVYSYCKGWWLTIQHWGETETQVTNWLLAWLCVLAFLQMVNYSLMLKNKIFPTTKCPLQMEIGQLIIETSDMNVDVATLLRKTKVIASRLNEIDFVNWINSELSGYKKDLPEYREIYGHPQALNPYRGWEPIQFEQVETQKIISMIPLGQAIGPIEETLRKSKDGGGLSFSRAPEQKHMVMQMLEGCTDFRVTVEASQLHGILDVIRNKIQEWALGQSKKLS